VTDKACLVGTLTTPPSPESGDLHGLPDSVEWLEVGAYSVGSLLFTLRSAAESDGWLVFHRSPSSHASASYAGNATDR
jgi:hypothetical protein